MIDMTKQQRTYIGQYLTKKFGLDNTKTKEWLDDIAQMLKHNPKTLYRKIHRSVFSHKDATLADKVMESTIDIYTYLAGSLKTEAEQTYAKTLFFECYDHIFAEKYKKRQKEKSFGKMMIDTQQLMIANISHEMRTSLNAIIGYASILKDEERCQGNQRIYLDKLLNASESLKTLVSDILDTTKIHSDQMELNESYFWLGDVVMHSLDNVVYQANAKHLKIENRIDFFPNRIYGDAQRIMEIFTNLLTNAVKFTKKGTIFVRVEKISETDGHIEVLFEVKDTGKGMSREETENIFHPYIRHDNTTQGVGLGLYISKMLAEKMGGEISVTSEKEKGSTFRFIVRLKQEMTQKIGFQEKYIYFLNEKEDNFNQNYYRQRAVTLKEFGAHVKNFDSEKKLLLFLMAQMESKKPAPDILSITTKADKHQQYDALVNYLKSFSYFDHTYFISESNESKYRFKYFDKSIETFTDISFYIDRFKLIESEKEKKSFEHFKILAVDDIATNLEVLKLFIQKKYPNIRIDMASGGYEAIGMYKINTYDLLFLDIKMPGLDGFATLKELKKIHKLPLTYALTGDVYRKNYEQVLQIGFDGIVEKPVSPEKLYSIIKEAAEHG